jgi:hypothetical protein
MSKRALAYVTKLVTIEGILIGSYHSERIFETIEDACEYYNKEGFEQVASMGGYYCYHKFYDIVSSAVMIRNITDDYITHEPNTRIYNTKDDQ